MQTPSPYPFKPTLDNALETITETGGARASVKKHLRAVGIVNWSNISKIKLYELRDEINGSVSANTAKTLFARISSMFGRFEEVVEELPEDWRKVLTCKGEQTVKTYLTPEELEKFECVQTKNPKEEVVRCECLLEAYTGARVSDIVNLTTENIEGDNIVYVSVKTGKRADVPFSQRARTWLEYAQDHRADAPTYRAERNDIVRRLCQRAGIYTPVMVHVGGKDERGPKYMYVTSHTFRISFVTNLHKAGLDLLTISRMAGHSSVAMTERYCAITRPKVTGAAAKYLGIE